MRTPDDAVVTALERLYTLVVIVGLPGSGKTDFATGCVAPLGYVFHDDFIRDFHNGAVRADIGAGQRVCVADARICAPARF
jgi:predicted kinase